MICLKIVVVKSLLRVVIGGKGALQAFLTVLFYFAHVVVILAEEEVLYNRDIRPILSDNCFSCHGPDSASRKADVRLDQRDAAIKSQAIVPCDTENSSILARVFSEDPEEVMPPLATKRTLTNKQKELLKRWIATGAKYQPHWSLIPPQQPNIPPVIQSKWVKNPIDNFVLAKIEEKGLTPSAQADRPTLIRRLTLDLTGLPPTISEIDDFVTDQSLNAYEKLVERLLASPHYGEHMARYWLDAVRYGDTHGLHYDNERALWKYRDWIINAFNQNLPFNQFTLEQMAGDLLPNATLEQKIASGYNRCNLSTNEAGSIDEELLIRYAADRTEAMATIWLGLTIGCASCHDHKFDSITQKEYYQLLAFFRGAADAPMDGNALTPAPLLKLPTPEQASAQNQLDEQIAAVQNNVTEELTKINYQEPDDSSTIVHLESQDYIWIDDALPSSAQPQPDIAAWQFACSPEPIFSGNKSTKCSGSGVIQYFFTGADPALSIGEGDRLFTYVYLDPEDPPQAIMMQFYNGTWEHRIVWGNDSIPLGTIDTASRFNGGTLPEPGKWIRLEVNASDVGLSPGTKLSGWSFTQNGGTAYWDKAGIVTRTPPGFDKWDSQIAWETYERSLKASNLPMPVIAAIKIDRDNRNNDQTKIVRDHFLQNVYIKARATFAPLQQQLTELNKKKSDLDGKIITTMVMEELSKPRETFLLIRGEYDKHGEKVAAAIPAVLPSLPSDAPVNRLGLAQWLINPANPLTARVTVNRFWQQYFGSGIVKTTQDFGIKGELPTHPELLDWLATEFTRTGWDVKQLQRLIVTSATYRQASRISPAHLESDAANDWLARGPRFRLDAEIIRDSALAASGLLVNQIGGRSVRPYQPDGVWNAVAFVGSNTANYKVDQGESLYRRSLYIFWKRTAPPTILSTFDAPSRETCTVRRARTNTPLQALLLMNDIQYVEAARKLAERMMLEGGSTTEQRALYGFRLATGRHPQHEEIAILTTVFGNQLAEYQADRTAADKLLRVGDSKRNESLEANELAAWTMIANLILNLDETVTKE